MPDQITKAQESAVTFHKGACLTIAAPGSGKTFVITNRVVHLVQNLQIPSEHILVITFTKAAATEMEERFHAVLPKEKPWFGTFHSCFYYILRNSYTSIPNRFISTEEKHRLLKNICNEVLGNDTDMSCEDIERILGLYMNNGLTMHNIPEKAEISNIKLKELYVQYHQSLAQYGYMDFDDLQLCCYQILKENAEVRQYFQKQFQYILIDECQDMNALQYEIIKLLAGHTKNVFMVGDDDQSVYRFRGARVELMEKFLTDFKPVKQISLDINFRSTAQIINSSVKVISENKNRFFKKIKAHDQEDSGVHIESFEYKKEMYDMLFQQLLKDDLSELNQKAIIYRTNQELRRMAYKLRQEGIPYISKEDQKSMFDEEWYLDIEAYFKLGLGSLDRQYVLRAVNRPNRFIKREQLADIKRLPQVLEMAVKHIKTMRPYLAIKYIWSGIGYGRWLERECDFDTEKWDMINEQLEEITEDMKRFSTIEDWLRHVEEDRLFQKEHQKVKVTNGKAGVHLLTMHASKGLEFESVFLPDVNKGKIPKGSKLSKEELEEERRLFYVAMTRAKHHLYVYYIKGSRDHEMQPSIFLEPLL